MTATPKRQENIDTYRYFGEPVYTYSLRQGIQDGFLAPYRVHRVVTDVDAAGLAPHQGELDRLGRDIPDKEYSTTDFERIVSLMARTEAIARHLTRLPEDRPIASPRPSSSAWTRNTPSEMRQALDNLNADLVRQYPDYVVPRHGG